MNDTSYENKMSVILEQKVAVQEHFSPKDEQGKGYVGAIVDSMQVVIYDVRLKKAVSLLERKRSSPEVCERANAEVIVQ